MRPAVDTDERPFVLVWEVTRACDLACKHCRADAEPERHPDELSTAEGRALLADVREFGEGQLVVLSGGDPLKRPDLVELVAHGADLGLGMTLTPSGTDSLTRAAIDDLDGAGLRRLALSLDGSTAARHDEFRGEAGSFDATVAAARWAGDAGLPLQVNTTVCAATVDDLPEIRDLVADLGAVLWSVFFLVPVGRGAALSPIPAPQAEQVMAWLAEVAETAPFGVKTTEAPHYRRVVAQRRRGEAVDGGRGPGVDCDRPGGDRPAADRPDGGRPDADSTVAGPGRRPGEPPDDVGRRTGIVAGDGFAFVSHVGEVYPSGFLPRSAGNVRESSIVDVYREADLFRALRDRDRLVGKCGACEFRGLCGGSRSRAYAYTGDPLAADPLCAYRPAGYDGPMPEQRVLAPADGGADAAGD